MSILYKSTRGVDETTVTASQAILQGLAKDGGLFVPTELPELDEYIKGEGKFSARLYYLGEDGTGFPSSGQSAEVEYALDVGEYALVIIAKPTYDNVKWKYAKYVRFLSVVDN